MYSIANKMKKMWDVVVMFMFLYDVSFKNIPSIFSSRKIALLISLSPRIVGPSPSAGSQSQPNSPGSKQSTNKHENKCFLLHASEFCNIIVAITS